MIPKLTQQQAVDLVNGAVGKCIDTDLAGVKDDYGCQCEAFISWYLTNLGYPSVMKMNAIDFWNNNPLHLSKISSPQPGDILYINSTFQGQHFSHVGVVIKNGGANIVSVDANWVNANLNHGSPAAIVVHPSNSITGFYRPSFKQEELMQVFDERARVDWNLILFDHDEGLFHECVGMEFKAAMYKMKDLPAFKHEVYANGLDIQYYLQTLAGHAASDDDKRSFGVDPTQSGDQLGTQSHKQVIYELMKRPDVLARQAPITDPSSTVLSPGHYEVKG